MSTNALFISSIADPFLSHQTATAPNKIARQYCRSS